MSDKSLKYSSIDTERPSFSTEAYTSSNSNTPGTSKLSLFMSDVQHSVENQAVGVDENLRHNMADDQPKLYNDSKKLFKVSTSSSPETLQDVDNSYGIGYKSPCISMQSCQGTTSPATQGRSVREFEEQMATLRKENFNLKLRLYFIEESIPGYQQNSSPEGQETFMKQLIDMKVDIEILRKEIQEKQELLKEAAQAMNQMERIQKETEAKSKAITDELNHKIQLLEMEKEIEKSAKGDFMDVPLGKPDISDNVNSIKRIQELEVIVKESEEKLNNLQNQISKLDAILQKRDETIKEYEDKVKELVFQNAELLEMLENKEKEVSCAELERVRDDLQQHKLLLADKTCLLQEAEEQLKNRTQIHEKACRTIQKLMLNISNQQDEICKLKKKTSQASKHINKPQANVRIGFSDLEYSDKHGSPMSGMDTLNNELSAVHKQKYEAKIAEQDTIIYGLKDEVKKKTANLQNLVNKELWEKNREIEHLTKLINAKDCSSPRLLTKDNSAIELHQSFSQVDYLKVLERNKMLQKKVDNLTHRLSGNRKNDALITQLQSDVREARNDAEQAEKFRRECVDVCSILSNRLEELANFLNSLLKHKDVLGLLAADRQKAMRKAVERSLDLSKSLNITLSVTGASMIDHSLLQIHNLSEMFGDVELENKTFNSHEKLKTQVQSLESLKVENRALKQDLELNKDRSAEAIGKESLSFSLDKMDNKSESEAWSEPDRKVSMARIGLDEHLTKNGISSLPKVGHMESDSESEVLNKSRLSKTPPTPARGLERINQLEEMIKQRDERILDVQCQLVDADSQVNREHLKVIEITQELDQLRRRNEELHANLIVIGSEGDQNLCPHNHNLLLRQIEENSRSLKQIEEERDRIQLEARVVEMQFTELRTEMMDMKQRHEEALTQAQEQEQKKLQHLQTNFNEVLEARLAEQQHWHEDTLARDWISRILYEENQHQLKKMQVQLKEAQCQIESLKENETEMKQTIISSQLETRVIKKQLDESTIEASKAVLERTRALNEKLKLEKRVDELNVHLHNNENQLNEMQRNIEQLWNTQLELQQNLHVAQKQVHKVHGSYVSISGYTSEEVPLLNEIGCSAGASTASRRLNNPSPDQGIGSDAGRLVSVELSSAQHSNLKAVELHSTLAETKEITVEEIKSSNLQPQNSFISNIPHNCAKVDQENIELRRKLIHTKRALEDTYEKLRFSNQRKAQVEKDIKNQILKTHNVLRNVRSNMENEL